MASFGLTSTFGQPGPKPLTWKFDAELQQAYRLLINLQPEEALSKVRTVTDRPSRFYRMYLESLAQTLDILITENEQHFPGIEDDFEMRLDQLEDEPDSPDQLFLRAELNLQLGFCHLNLSQQWSAILAIREAYQLVLECRKKYPHYIPIRKTGGVIQVMVGAVPDKYHWFMMLLGMRGTVEEGQRQLNELRNAGISLSMEANILYFTVKGFINQQFKEASEGMTRLLSKDTDNKLLMFMAVNMMMKNHQSEDALQLILKLDQKPGGLPLVYIDYLRAEILLQKGLYPQAMTAYQRFMAAYRGSSFKKDATYKIALAHHLSGKADQARIWWEKAKKTGKSIAEPDASAAFALEEDRLPDIRLMKIRLLIDGGYFAEAKTLLNKLNPTDLTTEEDKAELTYRKARLAHLSGETAAAKGFYLKTIELTADHPWYIAPSSALQLGYIFHEQGDRSNARRYFQMALAYRRHAYKSSIDGKARSALDGLDAVRN